MVSFPFLIAWKELPILTFNLCLGGQPKLLKLRYIDQFCIRHACQHSLRGDEGYADHRLVFRTPRISRLIHWNSYISQAWLFLHLQYFSVLLPLRLQAALLCLFHITSVCSLINHWPDLCFQSLVIAVAGLLLSRPRRSSRRAPSFFLGWHLDHVIEAREKKLFIMALEHQLVLEEGYHMFVCSSYSIVVVSSQDEDNNGRHSKPCCSQKEQHCLQPVWWFWGKEYYQEFKVQYFFLQQWNHMNKLQEEIMISFSSHQAILHILNHYACWAPNVTYTNDKRQYLAGSFQSFALVRYACH